MSYPLYDAHGNMISTLAKNGTGYTYSAVRTFDAWGNIRLGAQTGDPKGRYCASLGHKQDDESGLVYMRARYYESTSGRFVNSDRAREGNNFFIYCHDNPVTYQDASGSGPIMDLLGWLAAMLKDATNATDALLMIGDVENAEDVAYQEWMNKALEYETQADAAEATSTRGTTVDAGERARIVQFLRDSAAECREGAKAERAFFKEQMRLERMMYEMERDAEL